MVINAGTQKIETREPWAMHTWDHLVGIAPVAPVGRQPFTLLALFVFFVELNHSAADLCVQSQSAGTNQCAM
jgi:hypothetical protein